jgi:hypothetical protein
MKAPLDLALYSLPLLQEDLHKQEHKQETPPRTEAHSPLSESVDAREVKSEQPGK